MKHWTQTFVPPPVLVNEDTLCFDNEIYVVTRGNEIIQKGLVRLYPALYIVWDMNTEALLIEGSGKIHFRVWWERLSAFIGGEVREGSGWSIYPQQKIFEWTLTFEEAKKCERR